MDESAGYAANQGAQHLHAADQSPSRREANQVDTTTLWRAGRSWLIPPWRRDGRANNNTVAEERPAGCDHA
jgi:hypothetical protein